MPVLIDGEHPDTPMLLAGRLPSQAPEVDGMVIINRGTASPGQIIPALITASHDYDLVGEVSTDPRSTG